MTALSSGLPAENTVAEFMAMRHSKWGATVLVHLDGRTLRFSELKREISGISQKALTVAVRELERNGFITRTRFASIPPRVDYALTNLGADLLTLFGLMEEFMERNWDEVLSARQRFDEESEAEEAPIRLIRHITY